MSLKTIDYGGLSFPCSRHGKTVPENTFDARMLITRCGVSELTQLGRPANEKIRDLWMTRFVNEMHWLPLVETLIGCDRVANPKGNRAFLSALRAANPLRVCHRPRGRSERSAWAYHLKAHAKKVCPDPRIYHRLGTRFSEIATGADVFFVSADCEPAATQSQTADEMWVVNSWVFYRHTCIGSCMLTNLELMAIALGIDDPSDVAAKTYKNAW